MIKIKFKFEDQAQTTIEFTFAMVIVALLIFGLIKTLHWVGMDYAQEAYIQRQANVFVHPNNCNASSHCYSSLIEDNYRGQPLRAFTDKF